MEFLRKQSAVCPPSTPSVHERDGPRGGPSRPSLSEMPRTTRELGEPEVSWTDLETVEGEKKEVFPLQLGTTSPLNRVTQSANGRTIMPFKSRVTLPYVELLSISSPASANLIAGKVFHLTSVYDPNYTDTGHQPLGYDQWAAFYNEYFVHGVSWEVEFSNLGATHTLLGNVMAHPSLTLSGSQADTYMEQPGAKSAVLRHSDAGPAAKLRGKVDIAKWFGLKGNQLAALDDIRAAVGTSPTQAVGLHVGIGTLATHASQVVYAVVRLKYDVTFLKPAQLLGS